MRQISQEGNKCMAEILFTNVTENSLQKLARIVRSTGVVEVLTISYEIVRNIKT